MCARSGHSAIQPEAGLESSCPHKLSPPTHPPNPLTTASISAHKFSSCFPQVSGVVFPLTLQSPARPPQYSCSYARLKVLCVALSANTFLFAAAYLSRRDTGRRLGLLAL